MADIEFDRDSVECTGVNQGRLQFRGVVKPIPPGSWQTKFQNEANALEAFFAYRVKLTREVVTFESEKQNLEGAYKRIEQAVNLANTADSRLQAMREQIAKQATAAKAADTRAVDEMNAELRARRPTPIK